MKYCFVINAREDKNHIQKHLQEQIDALPAFDYSLFHTTCPEDATRYVKEYCESHPDEATCFVACGGDGTINEVVSGMVGYDNKSLAVMAYGSGNDFVKYYPDCDFCSLSDLLAGEVHKIDVLKVNRYYSLNVCNFGFDAHVCSVANRLSAKGCKWPYRRGVLSALLHSMRNPIRVTADGECLNRGKDILLCTLANCHYVGGEYFCAPHAKNDDGLIDLCLVHPISVFTFLKLLPYYTRGEHLDNPKFLKILSYRQVKHVELEAPAGMEICLDGEMRQGSHFDIDLLEKAVPFIVPRRHV